MKTITRLDLTVAAVITTTPEGVQALCIDTLMVTPFPTNLVAAPTGGAIACNCGVPQHLIAEPTPGTGPMAGRTDQVDACRWFAGFLDVWILAVPGPSGIGWFRVPSCDARRRNSQVPRPVRSEAPTDPARN